LQFVYTCRDGQNEELRYSIRSVLEFFPNAEIWVIGGKPSWYVGNYIKVKQNSAKYLSVKNNIYHLLSDPRINESFIYMNDDFYFTDTPDFSNLYHRGSFKSYLEAEKECCQKYIYYKMMNRTHNKIKKIISEEPLNYELHIPISITKKRLERSYNKADLWRSFYGNYYKIGGVQIEDCKVYKNQISDGIDLNDFIKAHSPFLSSNDEAFEFLLENYLKSRFPEKSSVEG
jgi:hypothetical protein